jgi:hypothetical protein
MEPLLKQLQPKKERLPRKFVIITMLFTRESTNGLILISIFLDAQQLRNTPKLPKTFSMTSIKMERPVKRLLLNSTALSAKNSLLIGSCMESVLIVEHQTAKVTSAMHVESL